MGSEDIHDTAALFQEMQAHYRVGCPPLQEIVSRLNELPQGVTMLVAGNPHVVGFAAVSAIFPGPNLKPGLFLKELFVSAAARGSGAGTALMRGAARLAIQSGFTRLDWTADRADHRLMGFYEAIGGAVQNEKVFLRLTGEALARLAGEVPASV